MFWEHFTEINWQMLLMWGIGALLIYLAIAKDMEPALLLPMGFGAILVNLPLPDAAEGSVADVLGWLFRNGIDNELLPLLLFIGIGAMIDFGPLLSNPRMILIGAAAQFGIFFTLAAARLLNFDVIDAASIAVIGTADGPTSIFVATHFDTQYIGAIIVAAYSYMALVPIVQPPVIRALTSRKERLIRMHYEPGSVSKMTRIVFPISVTVLAGLISPQAVVLIGFLMFGNLIRECGVLGSLSETAQKVLANLVTLLLGLTVSVKMHASLFLTVDTMLILGLGLVAFIMDTVGGVLFVKFLNLFLKKKINPMIGATGISAFPMSARVIAKMSLKEDPENHILMHALGANVSGQIASVIAGGVIIMLIK